MPGIKRARPESDETTNMTENQKRKGDGQTPFQKKPKTGGSGKQHPKYQPKKFSLNPLKDKIRDLRRQLSRVGEEMPANIRVDKERELASKEHELWVAQGERLKQDLIPKYHKARFFERQKATRFLKKAVRNLNENSDPAAQKELEDQKHIAEVDLNYTLYYPLIRPYTSLYASGAKSKSTEKDPGGATKIGGETVRVGGDETMWKEVETRTTQGTSALEALRNGLEWREGKDGEKSTPPPAAGSASVNSASKKTKARTTKKTPGPTKDNKAKKQDKADEEEDEDSDGGFFE